MAFPELALPVIVMLKRWLKDANTRGHGHNNQAGNKNGKVNSAIALLVQKLEANSRFVEGARVKVDFAPNNRAGVEGFLKEMEWEKTPLGAFVVGQRKMREEKAKLLEESRRQNDAKERDGDAGEDAEGAFEESDGDASVEEEE